MKKNVFLFIIVTLFYSLTQVFAEDEIATVIILRGDIKAKEKDSNAIIAVSKGMNLKEGTVLQSGAKSFVKLLFIDKSEMSLGPESQMVINSFPKDQAGILTLVKGQLRSKVTKDYMDMSDKDKSKLFIKTQSAAMGVRGTDFQVNYDKTTSATTLVTFSGIVAMTHISELAAKSFDRVNLESALHSKEAVLVQKGEFAGTTQHTQATTPEKLPADKLEILKSTEGTKVIKEVIGELINSAAKGETKEDKKEEKKDKKEDKKEEKKEEKKDEAKKEEKPATIASEDKKEGKKEEETGPVRSIVPPGLNADMVANKEGGELEKSLASSLGSNAITALKEEVRQEITSDGVNRTPASVTEVIIPPPPPIFLPPPPPPIPTIDVDNIYKQYNNAPPPVIVDPNARVRFIFH